MLNPSIFVPLLLLAGCPLGTADDDDSTAEPTPGLCDGVTPVAGTDVELEVVATNIDYPVYGTHAGDGTGRFFVVAQEGRVFVLAGDGEPEEYLDISNLTSADGEQGLLSIAFHPAFASNGRLYTSFTDNDGDSQIVEFTVTGDTASDRPDGDSARTILSQAQPFANHNGGQIAFGPDGYLYIGFGDGGAADDPYENGQDRQTWLGKILRIDVDGGDPYGVPLDNPFVDDEDYLPEIFTLGMRNPWRFSFDRETGDFWVADVGQNEWEEVDLIRAGGNYGWNVVEGPDCFEDPGCDLAYFDAPIFSYPHSAADFGGVSVSGGFVYRGCKLETLRGRYIFSDFDYVDSPLWTLTWDGSNAVGDTLIDGVGDLISGFGEDEQGEVYVMGYRDGQVFKIVPAN